MSILPFKVFVLVKDLLKLNVYFKSTVSFLLDSVFMVDSGGLLSLESPCR